MYKRILLKLSGEAMMGDLPYGISHEACFEWAQSIKELVDQGIQVALVIGAGNIFRGLQGEKMGFQRTPADHMGMLSTIINGLAFEQALIKVGVKSVIMSAVDCHPIAEPYNWQKALYLMDQGRVMLFVGGTGSPYFTTDTAAALRASQMSADILMKGTKVNGVFSKDPVLYPDAERYESISYDEVLAKNLGVMDATSIALCRSNKLPILVFNMKTKNLLEALQNKDIATIVH